jgi:uncharacterized membrane protein
MRYLIAILALAGAAVSTMSLRGHYSTETEPCSINAKWDYDIVDHSPFSEVEGIPVAAIGIAGYLALAVLALMRKRARVFLGSLIGLGISLYLAHIQRDVLMAWCQYCVISLGIMALITALSMGWAAFWGIRSRYE